MVILSEKVLVLVVAEAEVIKSIQLVSVLFLLVFEWVVNLAALSVGHLEVVVIVVIRDLLSDARPRVGLAVLIVHA